MEKRIKIKKSNKVNEVCNKVSNELSTINKSNSTGINVSNEELNARLADLLTVYGQNIQYLGVQVHEVNNRLGEVYKKVEVVNTALEDMRVDHVELKQLTRAASAVRNKYKELFEQKASLFNVTTHAITKVFDYVMYSQMFDYLGKEPVTLTGVNQGHINMSTKELTKRELPFAIDYLEAEFELDLTRFNNHLYRKYKKKLNDELQTRYHDQMEITYDRN